MSKPLGQRRAAIRAAKTILLATVSLAALASLPAHAEETADEAGKAKSEAVELAPLKVEGEAPDGLDTALPPTYAGGQVARGARIGVLGNQDMMDVPFSITSYTEETIRNQQAQTIGDILANDPSVRVGQSYGNYGEQFIIRGFPLYGDDIAVNGLYGIAPRQVVGLEMYERVEVLNGANAFLNGAPPGSSGTGGAINLVPKRAGDDPLTRVTATYGMDSQFGGHVDSGMRFGPNKAFGVRINVAGQDGDTAIEDEERRNVLGSAALDYRGERARISLDLAYQKRNIDQGRPNVTIDTVVPSAPDADQNFAPEFAYAEMRDAFAMLNAEYDLTDHLMAYASVGLRDMKEDGQYVSVTVLDAAGEAAVSSARIPREDNVVSAQGGVRAKFVTGPVDHSVNFGGSKLVQENHNAYVFNGARSTNIYDPTPYSSPDTGVLFAAGNLDDLPLAQRTTLDSLFVVDTVDFADDKVHLTLGTRYQNIHVESFDLNTFAKTSDYEKSAVTPVLGVAVNVSDRITLYANRIEGLAQGPTAGFPASNIGETFAPYRSKQYEVGGKVDLGSLGFGVALFQTEQPAGFIDPGTNIFSVDGEQRNRGVELTAFGEPAEGVRLLGGATLLDAELTKTAGGANDGNTAIGVPDYQLNLGAEWDLPFLPGVTLTGRVLHTDSQYVNATNTLDIPSWTRLDVGARYTAVFDSRPVTFNLVVDNVTNKSYWASASSGYVTMGDPLTARVSVSTDF